MNYTNHYFEEQGVRLQAASFADEFHIILHIEPREQPFLQQLKRLYDVEELLPSLPEFTGAKPIVKRYFLSDSANQAPLMRHEEKVATAFIQQQPLDGSKIAVWIYMLRGAGITFQEGTTVCSHNGYKHLWNMGMQHSKGNSAQQTEMVLTEYEQLLESFGATLAHNCVRTWFFVRDVDTQYQGMVDARRSNFIERGLTQETHYIASTGIQGLPADPHAIIQLGAYAVTGAWNPQQQHYLYAPDYLNPTYEYGVTFERGVCVEYGDRAHTIISGTASIDNQGNVLHVGDIVQQTLRMWENVDALLQESSMTFDDVAHLIVYLRDTADYQVVSRMFKERFPNTPTVLVFAPVCRPTWLIEMECIAVKARRNPQYADF